MHIFDMSVTYLQSIKRIHWKLLEELISQSMHYLYYCKHLTAKLQSGITLAILTLQPPFSYKTCTVWLLRCGANLIKIGQTLLKLQRKDLKMMTEWRKDGKTEGRTGWKQYTPLNYVKIIFSALKFFMHIFDMSVTYLQSIKRIHWKLLEELISQSMHYLYYCKHLTAKLQSGITLAILTLQPPFSYKTCTVWLLRCGANLIKIGQTLLKLQRKDLKMMTERRKDGKTEGRTGWKQLQIKFGYDWPTGCGEIRVWKCLRTHEWTHARTDAGSTGIL